MSQSHPIVTCSDGLASLGNSELLAVMKRLAAAERTLSVYALAHLGEIQRRMLYEAAGFSTMFAYCVGELRYSQATAYRRLQAAEASRKFPEVLTMIKDGCLTICALSIMAKHLTQENRGQLLQQVEGKSVRDVERLAAELAPQPDTRDLVRAIPASEVPALDAWVPALNASAPKIAARTPEGEPPPPTSSRPPQKIMPRSLDRVLFSFTGSEELRRVIDRCREILWHKHPTGRLEDILLEVGQSYLSLKDPELLPASKPKPPRTVETRVVPRWVRSVVYRRDEGRCVFLSVDGHRCEARQSLEYDHIRPWARGGRSDDPKNIRLLCRAHNQRAARAEGLA